MFNERIRLKGEKTNADQGAECCAEIYSDDGRVTYGDSNQHKGDWGRHKKEENLERRDTGNVFAF